MPKTNYQDHTEQIFLKDDFEEQEPRKAMVTLNTIGNTDMDRYGNEIFLTIADNILQT